MNILSGFFSEDLAIDLGTVNTIVYTPTEGVVLNAINRIDFETPKRRAILEQVARDAGAILPDHCSTPTAITLDQYLSKVMKRLFHYVTASCGAFSSAWISSSAQRRCGSNLSWSMRWPLRLPANWP